MIFRGEPENANRQAADWLARLHADDRAVEDEAAFRIWLDADSSHQEAFERASAVWDAVGGLRDHPPLQAQATDPARLSRRAVIAGSGGVLVAAGLTLGWREARAGVYRTEIGEQRRLVLDDGTRVMLDTDCVNQDGEVVVSGTAEVIAPKEKVRRRRSGRALGNESIAAGFESSHLFLSFIF